MIKVDFGLLSGYDQKLIRFWFAEPCGVGVPVAT